MIQDLLKQLLDLIQQPDNQRRIREMALDPALGYLSRQLRVYYLILVGMLSLIILILLYK